MITFIVFAVLWVVNSSVFFWLGYKLSPKGDEKIITIVGDENYGKGFTHPLTEQPTLIELVIGLGVLVVITFLAYHYFNS